MPTLLECRPLARPLQATVVARPIPHPEGLRRVTIVALISALMAIFLPLLGFSIDFGQVAAIRHNLESQVQSSALAAVQRHLVQHTPEDSMTASSHSPGPSVTGPSVTGPSVTGPLLTGDTERHVDLQFGRWNDQLQEFQVADAARANAVQAVGAGGTHALYFSRLLGRESFRASAVAVGVLQPREIVLVVDSGASSRPAVTAAVRQLAHQLTDSRTEDRLALILHGESRGQVTMPVPLSRDPSRVLPAWTAHAGSAQPPAEGLTAAIRMARRHLRKAGRPGTDRAIWVISDRGTATSHLSPIVLRRLENELCLTEEQSIRVDSVFWSVSPAAADPVVELACNVRGRHHRLADLDGADASPLLEAFAQLESGREVRLIQP